MTSPQGIQNPIGEPSADHVFAQAIIDTIREPLIVLDGDLRIVSASRSFFRKFALSPEGIYGTMFYDLGNGEWNIPALRTLLERVIPEQKAIEDYEVEHEFLRLGTRTMLVNAREILLERGDKRMLLSIFDVTDQRETETTLARLASQKSIMLEDMRHRISNSLQLIANILSLKAVTVTSEEARIHLEDAHGRIISIANVQRYLDPKDRLSDHVEIGPYLTALCANLSESMIGGNKAVSLTVVAGPGSGSSDEAISIGLLTTELVINALKYAFPAGKGAIIVSFESSGSAWSLSVSDDGVGYTPDPDTGGLGTSIVRSLAAQLKSELTITSSSSGTTVSLACTG